jgi:imidazolonepropionase-like amidohydrolase
MVISMSRGWAPRAALADQIADHGIGTVEPGKLADLIVVAANPLEDITNVRRLQLVLKEGRVVSDKRHLSGAVP